MEGFLLQSRNTLEINTTPDSGEETFEKLAAGITNMEPDPNEEIAQDNYFDGDGFGESDVTGAQLILSISGYRKYDDPAQNYIYGLQMELGPARRTTFRLTLPDGATYEGPCTIANIVGPGGAAGEKGAISFEIHFAGKPKYTPADEAGAQSFIITE